MKLPPINYNLPDIESDRTSRGQHNRLVVFRSWGERRVTIREDLQGLPLSTEAQRMRAAMGWQRHHPSGTALRPTTTTEANGSIFHEYEY